MSNDQNADAVATINDAWMRGWPKVVARAWIDEDFRQRLLANPAEAIAEFGLPMLDQVELKVVAGEAAPPTMVLTLPDRPADLGEESIEGLVQSGARASHCMGTSCCC
jgi:hypothetical protein